MSLEDPTTQLQAAREAQELTRAALNTAESVFRQALLESGKTGDKRALAETERLRAEVAQHRRTMGDLALRIEALEDDARRWAKAEAARENAEAWRKVAEILAERDGVAHELADLLARCGHLLKQIDVLGRKAMGVGGPLMNSDERDQARPDAARALLLAQAALAAAAGRGVEAPQGTLSERGEPLLVDHLRSEAHWIAAPGRALPQAAE